MPAVLKIGSACFFFASVANAAKAADLLNKATPVERMFGRGDSPDTYNLFATGRRHYMDEIEIDIVKQTKPKPALLQLPEPD